MYQLGPQPEYKLHHKALAIVGAVVLAASFVGLCASAALFIHLMTTY